MSPQPRKSKARPYVPTAQRKLDTARLALDARLRMNPQDPAVREHRAVATAERALRTAAAAHAREQGSLPGMGEGDSTS